MVEVGIEGFTFGNVHAVGWFETVASQDVINIIDSTRSHSDFGEIGWPHSTIGVLSLILREVRRIDSVIDESVSLVPFLVVVLLEVMVRWVDCE